MINSHNNDLIKDAIKQLTVCWSNNKNSHHESRLILELILDGFGKHFQLFECDLRSLAVNLNTYLSSNCLNSSTTLKLYTIELLKLAKIKTTAEDIPPQISTIIEILLNDSDPIVRIKCAIAVKHSTQQSAIISLTNFKSKFSHVCDTNWCRIDDKTENEQKIWSVIKRVNNDLQFLHTEYSNNTLNLEQIQAINALPFGSLKRNNLK